MRVRKPTSAAARRGSGNLAPLVIIVAALGLLVWGLQASKSSPRRAEQAAGMASDALDEAEANRVTPVGLTGRVPLTTSRVIGSPDPPPPLRLARIYPALKFTKPLHIIKDPTTGRLLVTQQDGKILALSPDQSIDQAELFLDVGREAYSICFHPNYAENGQLFVFMNHPLPDDYDPEQAKLLEEKKLHRLNRISRYTRSDKLPKQDKPPTASPEPSPPGNEQPDDNKPTETKPADTKPAAASPEDKEQALPANNQSAAEATDKPGDQPNKPAKQPVKKPQQKLAADPLPLAAGPLPDPASELVILEYPSFGHNGHYLEFGPDGMLWISAGDGTQGMDINQDGQDTSNLRGNMLRIDVDRPEADRPYSIPADNPYAGRKTIRPEIWAFGFRNPYRFAFDPAGGQLLVADIGQDAWEMIYHVEPGHNYGWSVMEGSHPLNDTHRLGPAFITPPIVEHAHSEMRSITGGPFYQGKRFPEYQGAYFYGDYETGRLWALRYDYDQRRVEFQQEVADSTVRIISIGADADNELLLVSYTGELYQLERQPPAETEPQAFPRRLSETGLFADVAAHRMAAGVIPYSVNSPLWSDAAEKERYMAIPGEQKVKYTDRRAWTFPEGTVLVKTFSLPAGAAEQGKLRRIETRLLTLQQGEWAGYSYLWNDEQTDAVLVDRAGANLSYRVADSKSPGGEREQLWRFPSRVECGVCHTREARYVLGPTTLQMNRLHDYDGVVENQLAALDRIGLFEKPLPKPPAELASLPNPHDERVPLQDRVRSYLHANCAHCHVTSGGGNAKMELEFTKALEEMHIYDEAPVQTNFGIEDARLIAPGDPDRSIILQRIGRRGHLQMPPAGTNLVDRTALNLFIRWIRDLPPPADPPAETAPAGE